MIFEGICKHTHKFQEINTKDIPGNRDDFRGLIGRVQCDIAQLYDCNGDCPILEQNGVKINDPIY